MTDHLLWMLNLLLLPWHSYRIFKTIPLRFRDIFTHVDKNWVVLDIGANKGIFSWRFIFSGCTIYSVEPLKNHSINYAILKLLGSFFGTSLVHIKKAVVSDDFCSDFVELTYSRSTCIFDSLQGASIVGLKDCKSEFNVVNVPAIGINELFSLTLHGSNVSKVIIKMDIEGAETTLIDSLRSSNLFNFEGVFLVETHEKKYPHLFASTILLKEVLSRFNSKKFLVSTSWI